MTEKNIRMRVDVLFLSLHLTYVVEIFHIYSKHNLL